MGACPDSMFVNASETDQISPCSLCPSAEESRVADVLLSDPSWVRGVVRLDRPRRHVDQHPARHPTSSACGRSCVRNQRKGDADAAARGPCPPGDARRRAGRDAAPERARSPGGSRGRAHARPRVARTGEQGDTGRPDRQDGEGRQRRVQRVSLVPGSSPRSSVALTKMTPLPSLAVSMSASSGIDTRWPLPSSEASCPRVSLVVLRLPLFWRFTDLCSSTSVFSLAISGHQGAQTSCRL